jgi:O-antigen/teichoic acid export membrane protein
MALVQEPASPLETEAPEAPYAGRFREGATVDLRSRTARGTIVNAVFMVGTSGIALLQAVLIARLLPVSVLGLWGLLMAGFMTLLAIGSVGIDDKYIQQDDPDQRRAFEVAFTLQLALGAVFVLVILVGMPLFGLIYGESEIVLPGIALAAVMPALALQMPLWVHYRRMDFLRQRLLMTVDPVVTFVVTIALAGAGMGLWGLVIGAATGSWVAAVVMVLQSPYPLRLRWDRATFSEYKRFSMPLFVGAISTVLLIQAPVVVSARVLDVAAVAAIALAATISQFTLSVDTLVTQTLYPAICAVKDRRDLLYESFWKSNRLALLWAAPLGTAVALFAGDFVHYVIGEKWRFAVPLIAAFGLTAAINQIGFNWTAFFRALGDTRPAAVGSVVNLVAVLAIAVPLLAFEGITAFGVGMGIATGIAVVARLWYLKRIFPGLPLAGHVARGLGPTIPAAAMVLAVRALEEGDRTAGMVIGEVALFAAAVVLSTYLTERALLREAAAYIFRARPLQTPAGG